MKPSSLYLSLVVFAVIAPGCSSSGGSHGPTPCGPVMCTATEVCTYIFSTCGPTADIFDDGTCEPRPTTCDPMDEPVCGCDGTVYPSFCEARRAGTDVDANASSACSPPAGTLPCGDTFCKTDEVCREDFEGGSSCEPPGTTCANVTDCDSCEERSPGILCGSGS